MSTSLDSDTEGLFVQRGTSQSKSKKGGGQNSLRSQSRGTKNLTCHCCKKPGHFIAQYPKLKGRRKDPKQASTSTTEKSDTKRDTDAFISSGSSGKSTITTCILRIGGL